MYIRVPRSISSSHRLIAQSLRLSLRSRGESLRAVLEEQSGVVRNPPSISKSFFKYSLLFWNSALTFRDSSLRFFEQSLWSRVITSRYQALEDKVKGTLTPFAAAALPRLSLLLASWYKSDLRACCWTLHSIKDNN